MWSYSRSFAGRTPPRPLESCVSLQSPACLFGVLRVYPGTEIDSELDLTRFVTHLRNRFRRSDGI